MQNSYFYNCSSLIISQIKRFLLSYTPHLPKLSTMPQYLIIARDGTDAKASERRMNVRPAHFETAKQLKADDNFIIGGAILDDNGLMIGSMMVVQFETEDDLVQWMRNEPYINGNVWQSIEVRPFRVADV